MKSNNGYGGTNISIRTTFKKKKKKKTSQYCILIGAKRKLKDNLCCNTIKAVS